MCTTAHRLVERAQIGLASAEGMAGNTICAQLGVSRPTVTRWLDRYATEGVGGLELKRRQQGQPPAVITHAWKAQQRLHARFNHLSYRKRPQIAAVAVARELVGFP